jgi:hypothetical protein
VWLAYITNIEEFLSIVPITWDERLQVDPGRLMALKSNDGSLWAGAQSNSANRTSVDAMIDFDGVWKKSQLKRRWCGEQVRWRPSALTSQNPN